MKNFVIKQTLIIAFFLVPMLGMSQVVMYNSPCKSLDSSEKEIIDEMDKFGEEDNPLIIIEPNERRERVEIKLLDEEVWDLLILDCRGRLVKLGLLDPGMNKVSFDGLEDGIYYIYMSKGDMRWVKKVKIGD